MTAAGRSALLSVAGLAVLAFAAVALFGHDGATGAAAVDAPPAATAPPAAPTTSTTPATLPAAPVVVHVATPVPNIAGLSEAVTRVLVARGFAEMVGASDPTGEIPDSIASVLGARGVTLSVAQEQDAP